MPVDDTTRASRRRAVLAVVLAATADVTVFLIARALGVSFTLGLAGIDRMGGVTWYMVAAVAAAAALAGAAYAAVLWRALAPRRAAQAFAWTVPVVAVLSCVPLLALGLAAGTTAALALLHLVAGAVVLTVLLPAFRPR
jgi:Family of unknown function (DUF6069)